MFAAPILRNAASSSSAATASAFSQAHKSYVKSLYRRTLKNSLDWCIRRDVWRDRAIEIRVEFERHRNVRNPRELANLFEKAERELKRVQHPDPHRRKFLPLSCLAATGFGLLSFWSLLVFHHEAHHLHNSTLTLTDQYSRPFSSFN